MGCQADTHQSGHLQKQPVIGVTVMSWGHLPAVKIPHVTMSCQLQFAFWPLPSICLGVLHHLNGPDAAHQSQAKQAESQHRIYSPPLAIPELCPLVLMSPTWESWLCPQARPWQLPRDCCVD